MTRRSLRNPAALAWNLSVAVGLVLFAPPLAIPAFPQTTVTAASPSFTNEVLQNFDAWDKNHDGVLSAAEIDAVVSDSHVTGEAAAAAATLKMMIRGGKFVIPALTKEYFASYFAYASTHTRAQVAAAATKDDTVSASSGDAAAVGSTKNPTTAFPGYAVAYRSALRRIKLTQPDAFVGSAPELSSIKQGHIGDCFFLAVVGGYLHRNPADVRKMITSNSDGSFDVAFPSGKKAHVEAITDGDVALGSGSTGTGRWVSILEAAYGSLRTTTPPAAGSVSIDTDSIAKGGSIRLAMRTLTGHVIDRMPLRQAGVMAMPDETEVASKLPAIRIAVDLALRENRLIAAGTTDAERPAGITPRHAYAIIGYNSSADTITLWNPHGQTFTPKGEPGIVNGYPTKGGIFTVPVSDFARIFSGMNWELDQVAPTLPLPSTLPPTRTRTLTPIGGSLPPSGGSSPAA